MRALPILLSIVLAGPLTAQAPTDGDSAEDEVRRVVASLFDHMRAGDAEAMAGLMHDEVRLVTTGTRDGQPVAQSVPVARWLEGVAGASQVLDERLHDTEVRVDGGLASVWTGYTLFVGSEFSHCGSDAFLLVKGANGWKIISIADTRRTEGCAT